MLDGMTNIKAREVLKELKVYTEDLPHYSPDEVAEALEMANKALEQTRWIPVSERLPTFDEDVLVTNGRGIHVGWFDSVAKCWVGDSASKYFMNHIIKWMPLPELCNTESEE